MWIHQQPNWPQFTWDADALAQQLATVRYAQGKLIGRMEGLESSLQQEANWESLVSDAVKSSAIEGDKLPAEQVRSSLAIKLGISSSTIATSREVEGVVDMHFDATQRATAPLSAARLCRWQAALFPSGRSGLNVITVGAWRPESVGAMQVVSGRAGREQVHFEAPNARRLNQEMERFLEWFNSPIELDPVIKAGIAHLWFVTVHPFEDGNGRVTRAIGDMALARADGTPYRFYSLSSQIEAERADYYLALERQQRATADVTPWLSWFLGCLERTLEQASLSLNRVLYKADFWRVAANHELNARQRDIAARMLETDFEGFMNTSKFAKLAKVSADTALRDILGLTKAGLLIKNNPGGRSTSYSLPSREHLLRTLRPRSLEGDSDLGL